MAITAAFLQGSIDAVKPVFHRVATVARCASPQAHIAFSTGSSDCPRAVSAYSDTLKVLHKEQC